MVTDQLKAGLDALDEDYEDFMDLFADGPAPAPVPPSTPKQKDVDAKCGTISVSTSGGFGPFMRSLGTYLGNFFQCMILSIRGWAKDHFAISALSKNRRWLYMLVMLLLLILIIVIIVAVATPSRKKQNLRRIAAIQERQQHAKMTEETKDPPLSEDKKSRLPPIPVYGTQPEENNPLDQDIYGVLNL